MAGPAGPARRAGAFLLVCVALGTAARAQSDVVVAMHAGRHDLGVVRRGELEHIVTVDGQVAIDDRQDQDVLLVGPYAGHGATYVLVAESRGGKACPTYFQALDVSAARIKISPAFGNCNGQPVVTVAGGVLDVVMPRFGQAPASHMLFDAARGLRPAIPLGAGGARK